MERWDHKSICNFQGGDTETLAKPGIPYLDIVCIIDQIIKHGKHLNKESRTFTSKFLRSIEGNSMLTYKQVKVLRDIQRQCDPDYLQGPGNIKKKYVI
jgi:hypothetical protein